MVMPNREGYLRGCMHAQYTGNVRMIQSLVYRPFCVVAPCLGYGFITGCSNPDSVKQERFDGKEDNRILVLGGSMAHHTTSNV